MQRPEGSKLPTRVWKNLSLDPVSGCWVWTASLTAGYGQVMIARKMWRVHRLVFLDRRGFLPDPEGILVVLDHLCRNRACANPEHLEVVKQRENVLRGVAPTSRNAAKTACLNGHEFNEANTRVTINRYGHLERTCRACRLENYHARSEEINARRAEKVECADCGIVVSRSVLWSHRKSRRHLAASTT